MTLKNKKKLGAMILAGGKSRRFGCDKSLFIYQGETLIQRIIRVVEQITPHIRIIANWKQRPAFIHHPVHQDLIPDLGPLGGIFTGLTHSPFCYNLVVPCDMPGLSAEVLAYLWKCVKDDNTIDITVAAYENKIEPLIAVYTLNCLPHIKKQIDQNNMQIRQLFNTLKTKKVYFSPALSFYHTKIFFNMNTPEKAC